MPVKVENQPDISRRFFAGMGVASIGALVYYFGVHQQKNQSIIQNPVAETAPTQVRTVSGKMGKMKLNLFPEGDLASTVVTLNSQKQTIENGDFDAPVGEPLTLVVERPGFVPFRKEFTIQERDLGAANDYTVDVSLEQMAYGLVSISTRPAVADVTIVSIDRQPAENSKPYEFKTPISQEKLPAGNYRVTIKNEFLGVEKVMNLEVKEGKEIVLTDVKLEIKN